MANLLTLADDPIEVSRIVDEVRREVRYIVTDFTAELIVSKFKSDDKGLRVGDIYVPEYQRSLAWNEQQSSYFIESVILRVPVPPVFLYDVNGKLEIVDGSQRVRSLHWFVDRELELRGLEKLEVLNGYRYRDLPETVRLRFDNTPIRAFVLDEGVDESTRVDLFRRLNTTGKRLDDAEIRKGAYRGPFLDLVVECADGDLFRSLTPRMAKGVNATAERQELVTRFFVYVERYMEFKHDVRKFLDATMIEYNNETSARRMQLRRKEFDEAMAFIVKAFPDAFYRKASGSLVPRVRFEAIAVGTALALRANPQLAPKRSDPWLRSDEFEELVRTEASNSAPRLRTRIEFVRDHLLGNLT